jgi:DNA-binding CsgD family transcriptional regulator
VFDFRVFDSLVLDSRKGGFRAARPTVSDGIIDANKRGGHRGAIFSLVELIPWSNFPSSSLFPSNSMKRQILIYGVLGGILITVLKVTEYRFLVVEHSIEIYGGLIAATFAILGIWLGLKLTGTRQQIVVKEVPIAAATSGAFVLNERKQQDLGITPRELEVLQLIAQGMSNREIAGKLFVSENTVKTHSSRVFDKLGARRRTQAVQLGKEFGLLP